MPQTMTGSEYAAKWLKNTLANKESARKGVEAVKESPNKKAAAAKDRYLANVQEAVSSGLYERANNAVPLEDWKTAYIEKGLKNLDNGVKLAESKMARHMDKYMPFITAKAEQIKKMAKGSRADAMARIEANLDALDEYKKMNRGR